MNGIQIFSSSTAGAAVHHKTEWMKNTVKAYTKVEPPVVYIDIDGSNKQLVWATSGKKGVYPLLFVDDNFIGDRDMVEELNEIGELPVLLGVEEEDE